MKKQLVSKKVSSQKSSEANVSRGRARSNFGKPCGEAKQQDD